MPTETPRMINMRRCVERLEVLNRINADLHTVYNLLKDTAEAVQVEPLTTSPSGLGYLDPKDLERLKSAWREANKTRLVMLKHTEGERKLFDSYAGTEFANARRSNRCVKGE